MKTIYKYPIQGIDGEVIQLPKGAEILALKTQKSGPVIWALVDPNRIKEARVIMIFGTGVRFNVDRSQVEYVGTYFEDNYVWHVFINRGD